MLLTKSIFRSVYNRKRREDNSLKIYTLFNYLERSSSLTSWMVSFLKLVDKEEEEEDRFT